MAIQLTIRNVPESVRDELAQRAARKHQSMQEFLLAELEILASKPSVDKWLEEVRRQKEQHELAISAEEILAHRDADRR